MRVVNWTENGSIDLINKADDRAPNGSTIVQIGYRHPCYDTFDNSIDVPANLLYSYPDDVDEIVESLDDDGTNFDEIFNNLDVEHKIGVLRGADLICWVQTTSSLKRAEKLGDDWLVEIEQELLNSGSPKFTWFDVGTQYHLIDKASGTYIYYADIYGDWKLTDFI